MTDKILKEAYDKLSAIEEAQIGQGNIRDEVIDALDEGLIDKDYLITAMLNYMSTDDVSDMLRANDINLLGYNEE